MGLILPLGAQIVHGPRAQPCLNPALAELMPLMGRWTNKVIIQHTRSCFSFNSWDVLTPIETPFVVSESDCDLITWCWIVWTIVGSSWTPSWLELCKKKMITWQLKRETLWYCNALCLLTCFIVCYFLFFSFFAHCDILVLFWSMCICLSLIKHYYYY